MHGKIGKAWASELERLLWPDLSLMGKRYGFEVGDGVCRTPNRIPSLVA